MKKLTRKQYDARRALHRELWQFLADHPFGSKEDWLFDRPKALKMAGKNKCFACDICPACYLCPLAFMPEEDCYLRDSTFSKWRRYNEISRAYQKPGNARMARIYALRIKRKWLHYERYAERCETLGKCNLVTQS